MISWQLSKQCIHWPVSPDRIAGSGINTLSSSTFLKLSADKLLLFKWSQAQVQFFLKACEISYVHRLHHYNFDFKLTPDVKIRPAITCREGSRFWLFSPWSRIVQAFRLIFMLWLVKIWQVSSCRKCMQLLKTCFLIAETDRVLCRQLVTFLTVFFHWMYKMKFSCYQESSVIQPTYNLTYFVWNKAAPDQSWPGQDLIPKCSVKDLGITLDSNISFNNHVNDLTLTLLHK